MSVKRSPRHPKFSLPEAVDLIRKLYNKEKQTKVRPEDAVKAWGYAGLNGASRTALGTINQYDLIEYDKKGVRISSLGLKMLLQPEGSREKVEAIREAAFSPQVFQDLYASYKDASNDSIVSHLVIDLGFLEDAARKVVDSYRETMDFLKLHTDEDFLNEEDEEAAGMPALSNNTPEEAPAEETVSLTNKPIESPRANNTKFFSFYLDEDVRAEVSLIGQGISREHLELLIEHLELTKKAFKAREAHTIKDKSEPIPDWLK